MGVLSHSYFYKQEEDIQKGLEVTLPNYPSIPNYIESLSVIEGEVFISEEEGRVTISWPRFKVTDTNLKTPEIEAESLALTPGANKTDSEKVRRIRLLTVSPCLNPGTLSWISLQIPNQ